MPNFKDSDLTELHFRLTYYDEDDLREMIADLVDDLIKARTEVTSARRWARAWKNRAKNWRQGVLYFLPVSKWNGPDDRGWRWR